ncbi:MAG: hypothetical protein VCA55_01070 [Verrucomicrobiales bacterium]
MFVNRYLTRPAAAVAAGLALVMNSFSFHNFGVAIGASLRYESGATNFVEF